MMTVVRSDSPGKARREDILVSVCISDLRNSEEQTSALLNLAGRIRDRYRFWEFVLVVGANEANLYLPLVQTIPNCRLLKVRRGSEHYRKRVVAASEAIGDVVVIASAGELPFIDVTEMIERAHGEDKIILSQRESTFMTDRVLAPPLVGLGRGAGFNVGIRDMQTITFPRTLLNQILARSDQELGLRFPPRDSGIPLGVVTATGCGLERRSIRDFNRRTGLLIKLLINFAPRLLLYMTLLSGLVAVLAAFYGLYAVSAWLILPSVSPGWLTLSLMLSFTACFLGCAIFGLCLGVQNLLGRSEQSSFDDVTGEVNRADLFGQVARDLNVEVEIERNRLGQTGEASDGRD